MEKRVFLLFLCTVSFLKCDFIQAGRTKKKWAPPQPAKAPTLDAKEFPPLTSTTQEAARGEPSEFQELATETEKPTAESSTQAVEEKKSDSSAAASAAAAQPAAQPGQLWGIFTTRKGRVLAALKNPTHPDAIKYLRTQDARHHIGRELREAFGNLKAEGLTQKTDALETIRIILTKCYELNIEINLVELQAAWAAIRGAKADVTGNLDRLLQAKRDQFMQEASTAFKRESELIAALAQLQHTAAAMRSRRADDPNNHSDTETKEWNRQQVFEVLMSINQPKTDDTLGVAISLQPTAPEEDTRD